MKDIRNETLPFPSSLDLHHIAHELQENIAQTAASVKMLVQSISSEEAYQSDKLAMIEQYMTVLMQDIRSLSTYVSCHGS